MSYVTNVTLLSFLDMTFVMIPEKCKFFFEILRILWINFDIRAYKILI